jgi:hypothetical protein
MPSMKSAGVPGPRRMESRSRSYRLMVLLDHESIGTGPETLFARLEHRRRQVCPMWVSPTPSRSVRETSCPEPEDPC